MRRAGSNFTVIWLLVLTLRESNARPRAPFLTGTIVAPRLAHEKQSKPCTSVETAAPPRALPRRIATSLLSCCASSLSPRGDRCRYLDDLLSGLKLVSESAQGMLRGRLMRSFVHPST